MNRLSVIVVFGLGLILSACSGEMPAAAPTRLPTSQPTGATTTAPTAATEPTAANTRTITDANGKLIEIPADPQRVVVIVQEDLDVVLALGFTPAGIANGMGQNAPPAYLAGHVSTIPNVGAMNSPNIEAIARIKPDLVLVGDMNEEYQGDVLNNLRQIAPTINTMVYGEPWQDHLNRVAAILNKQDAAKQVLADYSAKIETVKNAINSHAGQTVSIVRWNADGPSYMQKNNFSSVVLADVGLIRPATQQEDGFATSDRLSLEQLDVLEADWLFIGTLNSQGDDVSALESAKQNPLFQKLSVVKNNHVVAIDGAVWGTLGGPLAAQHILSDVEKALGA